MRTTGCSSVDTILWKYTNLVEGTRHCYLHLYQLQLHKIDHRQVPLLTRIQSSTLKIMSIIELLSIFTVVVITYSRKFVHQLVSSVKIITSVYLLKSEILLITY